VQVRGQLTDIAFRLSLADHAAQIATEAEVVTRAGQHDGAHCGVARAGHGSGEQIHTHLNIQGIGQARTVQRDNCHRSAGLDVDYGRGHGSLSYSSGAIVTRRPASSGVKSI
jgi:hypothetical protein